MPRHVRTPARSANGHQELVSALAQELIAARPFGQPIVIEEILPETAAIQVNVIWDAWNEFPREVRSKVIEDAYRQAMDEQTAKRITLALGMTVPEATSIGLLPFKIESMRRRDDDIPWEKYRDAAVEVGASVLESRDRPQLRFATLDDAQRAYERLGQLLPGSTWAIVEERYSSTD